MNMARTMLLTGCPMLVAALSLVTPVSAQRGSPIPKTPLPKTDVNRNPTITNPLPPNTGRYRVLLTGFAAAKETVDDPRDFDGAKDEVYAVGAFALFDRRDSHLISQPAIMKTREYGDRSKAEFQARAQAGSASPSGGIWGGGRGPDYVPREFDPRAAGLPVPSPYQFPLLLFEGGLSDGVEALLVAPSLWESDNSPGPYNQYARNWQTGGMHVVIGSPAVQNQLRTNVLTPMVLPDVPGVRIANMLAAVFSGGLIGSYSWLMPLMATTDRPIGLAPMQQAAHYQDRVVVITREKLTALTPGTGTTIAIPFGEPMDNVLNGMYTLYLRVERIQ